jgi:hypothetical protein
MSAAKPKRPSLAAMIEELEQERLYRNGAFKRPNFSNMAPDMRAMHDARLDGAIETLRWLKTNERHVKHRMAQ